MSEVINLNNTTPAAPADSRNAEWQKGATSGTDPASGYPIYPVSGYIPDMVGDTGSGGEDGLVPAPPSGSATAGKYLKADATWEVPPSGITELTGDVTAGPGSGSEPATVVKVNGGAVPASAAAVGTNSSSQFIAVSSLPPSGAAGGDLTGTYPNPTLVTTAVTAGSYTNADLTVDAKGRITAASNGSSSGSYYGLAQAIAANGQNTVTLGSTPLAGSVILYLNGLPLPVSLYSVSGAVATFSGTWTAGDVISASWATANATPGGITLGSVTALIRGTGFYASTASSVAVTWPLGTLAGDLAVIFVGGTGATQPTPSGWTAQFNPSSTFWGGAVFTKTLSPADIAAGSIALNTSGNSDSVVGIITFIGSPAILEVDGTTTSGSLTLTTTASASIGYTGVYFGSCGSATGTNTVNRGTLARSGNDGSAGSGMLYTEDLSSAGTVSATYAYGSGSTHFFQALVVIETVAGAAGITPELNQSQVIGLEGALSAIGSEIAALNPMTTEGDIIYGGTSGAPTRLGAGTSGYVLTTAGSGSAPSWAAGGGGGGGALALLEEHTASASAALDFTASISSTYDDYMVEVIGLCAATNGAAPLLQFSVNGGTSYDTTSIYDWSQLVVELGAAGTGDNWQASVNGISLFSDSSRVGLLSTAIPGLAGSFKLFDPLNATNYKFVTGQGIAQYSGSSVRYMFMAGGVYRNASAVNAFRIIMTSGNIALGTVRVYGLTH